MIIKDTIYRMRERKVNSEYASRLKLLHRRISYEKWLIGQKFNPVDLTGEQWDTLDAVVLMRNKGTIPQDSFAEMIELMNGRSYIQILYGDEAWPAEYRSFPAWSPDSFLAGAELCNLYVIRRKLWEQMMEESLSAEMETKGITCVHSHLYTFEQASAIREVMTRLFTLAGGFEKSGGDKQQTSMAGHVIHSTIVHMPLVLLDASAMENDVTTEQTEQETMAAEGQHSYREKTSARESAEQTKTGLSVIIPSKDNPKVLKQCLDALQKVLQEENFGTLSKDCEIIIVDNGSNDSNKAEIESFTGNMCYLYEPMKFNFSHMCNIGAQAAKGQILLFLNDDVELCANGALTALYEKAIRPYIGAVGLKLYYPGSTRIQHAGIQNLPGGPVHKLQFTMEEENDPIQSCRNGNVLAVTGACLMVSKEKFQMVGGFPESLQVAYNDVDLCLSLYEKGYYNVVIRDRYAYHHESLSRGNDLTPQKLQRLIAEREELYERHPNYRGEDPFYPEPLCRELGDTHIYPAFWDNDETWQSFRFLPMQKLFGRENKDIVLNVSVRPGKCLEGYTYLPGENNAVYQRFLALRKDGVDLKKEKFPYYTVILEEKYCTRTALEHPECMNVALCGFRLRLEGVPAGIYRPGVMYRSRIGRKFYCTFSEMRLEIGEDGSVRMIGPLKSATEQKEDPDTENPLKEA